MLGSFDFNGKHYASNNSEIVYACDFDQKAINTYNLNFGDAHSKCIDICDESPENIPGCDIIVGGFPCQSFSTSNPTKDPFDARGNLYKQMVRMVEVKQPKMFVAENVRGMLTLKGGSIFRRIVQAFEEAGYVVFHELMNASHYEVPQKRMRVILVGVRKDIWEERGDFVFPEKVTENNPVPVSAVIPSLTDVPAKYFYSQKAVEQMKEGRKKYWFRGKVQPLDQPCLTILSSLKNAGLNSSHPHLLVDEEKEIYRRFTHREAASIQSFPLSFDFGTNENLAYRQIGNAIPPVMFWHIMQAIGRYINA